jgi:TolB-like protein
MAIYDLLAPESTGAAKSSPVRDVDISPSEIYAALNHILASTWFFRSHRMSRLLQFLVKNALADEIRESREYSIGIEVFDRNPSTYNTYEDPIVRVQVGRLREKLQAYYADPGVQIDIVISIPVGKYMPVIRRKRQAPMLPVEVRPVPIVAVLPLSYIAADSMGKSFASGLSEELSYCLFRDFSYQIVPPSVFTVMSENQCATLGNMERRAITFLLEGSIRLEADRLRASLRLVDIAVGCITWAAHFDRPPQFSIAAQEELAASIGADINRFFCRSVNQNSNTAM